MTEATVVQGVVEGRAYVCVLHGNSWHVTADDLASFEIPVGLATEWPATVRRFAEDWIRLASEMQRMADAKLTRELPRE